MDRLALQKCLRPIVESPVKYTVRQLYIILLLAGMPVAIEHKELARACKISSPAISRALDKLTEDKLVERTRSEIDRRRVFVSVTLAAHSLLQSMGVS